MSESSQKLAYAFGRGLSRVLDFTRVNVRKYPAASVLSVGVAALVLGVSLAAPSASQVDASLLDTSNARIQALENQGTRLQDKLDDAEEEILALRAETRQLEQELAAAIAPSKVPVTIGEELDSAKLALTEAGYKVVVQEKECSDPAGSIVSCSPAQGSELDPGSTVTLVVAVPVPVVPAPTPSPANTAESGSSGEVSSPTVYITDTGEKYHTGSCRYLSKSKHAISLSEAKASGYTPCSVCRPPS